MTGHRRHQTAQTAAPAPGQAGRVRGALLELLAGGRAMTTGELAARLGDHDARLADLHIEAVYRHLDALARHGQVHRIRHHGRRYVFWAHSQSPAFEERP